MSFITVADFKTYRGITGTAEDTLIQSLINSAEQWINREIGRTVATDTETTEYIDAIGNHIEGLSLWVSDCGDCCEISSVTNGDGTTVATASYFQYPQATSTRQPIIKRLKLKQSSGLSWTYDDDYEQAIEIAGYWAMFRSDDVPDDLQQAAKEVTAYLYTRRDGGSFETVALPEQGVIVTPQGFPDSAMRIVRRYRKMVTA